MNVHLTHEPHNCKRDPHSKIMIWRNICHYDNPCYASVAGRRREGECGGGGWGGGVYLNPNNTPLARATGPDKCTSLQSKWEGRRGDVCAQNMTGSHKRHNGKEEVGGVGGTGMMLHSTATWCKNSMNLITRQLTHSGQTQVKVQPSDLPYKMVIGF